MRYGIVGCGGIGGWLAQGLARTLGAEDTVVLVDGDKFEDKNLDRQLYAVGQVGVNKAAALARMLTRGARCKFVAHPHYLGDLRYPLPGDPLDHIFCGADNHNARKETLNYADEHKALAVIAANGYTDAEAYVYFSPWVDSAYDPRTYYPEILTDHSDDPLHPPCTGVVLESTPQLAIANMSAANQALWLHWYWTKQHDKLETDEARGFAPYHVASSATTIRVSRLHDAKKG
jgi:molybdopterin/thiamine biosynthesis adenylyltransferase